MIDAPSASRLRLCRGLSRLLMTLWLAGCGHQAPLVEERLLVVDGLEIKLADAAPYTAFLDSFLPEIGRKTKLMRVLDEHLLPLWVGRRAFAKERQEQLARAEALCSVATNVSELEQQSNLLTDKSRKNLTRLHAKLPVAIFLFDPLKVGSVSPPIELPAGYIVAGCYDLTPAALAVEDVADSLQIGFVTHNAGDWYTWFEAEKTRLADKVTFVNPEYRDAMPDWLKLPKLP